MSSLCVLDYGFLCFFVWVRFGVLCVVDFDVWDKWVGGLSVTCTAGGCVCVCVCVCLCE